ncbi:MAG: hypothetical protein HQL16_06445 [Candidatus Omnitrophica bacterium]|nr:hypothetical protein [Candidatus Omnitrophota bacterium]
MSKKPLPIPLGMSICDMIIEDKKTGKKSLIGMFSTVSTHQVPCVVSRFAVFISLTEGIGDYSCSLRCIRAKDNLLIAETKGTVKFTDRAEVVEIALEIAGLSIPEYGYYRLELYCDDSLLISRKFTVAPMPQIPMPNPEETK